MTAIDWKIRTRDRWWDFRIPKAGCNDHTISWLIERCSIHDMHSLKLDDTKRTHPASLEDHYPDEPFSMSKSIDYFLMWFSPWQWIWDITIANHSALSAPINSFKSSERIQYYGFQQALHAFRL
jgi:hypothetical protein